MRYSKSFGRALAVEKKSCVCVCIDGLMRHRGACDGPVSSKIRFCGGGFSHHLKEALRKIRIQATPKIHAPYTEERFQTVCKELNLEANSILIRLVIIIVRHKHTYQVRQTIIMD